jgi:hypothetical protein
VRYIFVIFRLRNNKMDIQPNVFYYGPTETWIPYKGDTVFKPFGVMLVDILSFWAKFQLSGFPSLPAIVQKRVWPNRVQRRFSPILHSLKTDPDLGFGSAIFLNFDPNLGPVQVGSGSNRGSEPNIGITSGGGWCTRSVQERGENLGIT